MENTTTFKPVSIEDAEPILVSDYGYYCDDKVSMYEMPLSFEQWQEANYYMAEENM